MTATAAAYPAVEAASVVVVVEVEVVVVVAVVVNSLVCYDVTFLRSVMRYGCTQSRN